MAATNQLFEIHSSSYSSEVFSNRSGLNLMIRSQHYENDSAVVDAYGELWILALANLKDQQLGIRNGSSILPVTGPWGVFIGSFSIVEWQVKKGDLKWQALTALDTEPPPSLRGKVILFPWDKTIPQNTAELFHLVENHPLRREIEFQKKSSAVALKAKKYLDMNYADGASIENIGNQLGLSWSVMSREFKKAYGITPVEYRQKLQTFKALKTLSSGFNVTTALAESGFNSSSQFFHQFKKHLGVTPQNYQYVPETLEEQLGVF